MILITTSSTITSGEIMQYLDVISSHVVAGTNIFSDFAASFSDIFGGRSQSYQNQLASINEEVLKHLKYKAKRMGADCIIGLHIDHDQISGKNKNMFMVTAYGTAVKTNRLHKQRTQQEKNGGYLNPEKFQDLLETRKLTRKINNSEFVNSSDWDLIIKNEVVEVAPNLLRNYQSALDDKSQYKIEAYRDIAIRYFNQLHPDVSKKILYRNIFDPDSGYQQISLFLVKTLHLVDYGEIVKMLNENDFSIKKMALSLLDIHKQSYSSSDIEILNKIKNKISDRFPDRSQVIKTDGGILKKSKEKWICECGHENSMTDKYCVKCHQDKFGFTINEINPTEALKLIEERTEVLKEYFKIEALI